MCATVPLPAPRAAHSSTIAPMMRERWISFTRSRPGSRGAAPLRRASGAAWRTGDALLLARISFLLVVVSTCLLALPLGLLCLVLGAPGDADRGGLFEGRAVLSGERCRHAQLRRAEVPVRRERGERALGELQLEARDRHVRHVTERAARDPRFTDERFAVQVDRYAVTLQDDHQFGELRATI